MLEPFEVTGTIQREAWQSRSIPPVEEVRHGVWSIPIDFGHAPIRYTFCYALVAPSGETVIVDPGGDTALGRSQLKNGLALAGIAPAAVVGVVSTHLHLDHVGLVAYAAALGGGWIGYHRRDHEVALRYRRPDVRELDEAWLHSCGAPRDAIEKVVIGPRDLERMSGLPAPTLFLSDGDRLPVEGLSVRVVETPGHTPGHICLVDEASGLVFSGDHVLPRITPNVGMTSTGARTGSLAAYYDSLERITRWDGFEVCPAHEYRFRGLSQRADGLAEHQRARTEEIAALVGDTPHTIWEVASRTEWARPWASFDGVNLRAALGETAAHVDDLVARGRFEGVGEGPLRVASRRHASL